MSFIYFCDVCLSYYSLNIVFEVISLSFCLRYKCRVFFVKLLLFILFIFVNGA